MLRHEPSSANTAPGGAPSDVIIKKHPLTLPIEGHSHTYFHQLGSGQKEVVIGLGGAPVTGSHNFGYLVGRGQPVPRAVLGRPAGGGRPEVVIDR